MNKKEKDYLSYTLLFQFFICALLFGALFGFKQINSDIYIAVKDEYYANLNENFDIFIEENSTETKNNFETEINKDATEVNSVKKEIKSEEVTSDKLNVEIKGVGGQDYHIDKIDEIPENVSVNSYILNQRMVLPVNGKITSDFGVRNHPISNELRFHAGIDIAADKGTPIYAAFSGIVKEAKYDDWNGNYLKLLHDGEITTVYCHCDKLLVNKGDKVEAGDVVAYVGSTGSSTGPHLHFEFRVKNISYDPKTAISEAVSGV